MADNSTTADGDERELFFAYAKVEHEGQNCYILTFANLRVAEEWWQITQEQYPSSVRSNHQLFDLVLDGSLGKLLKNPNFEAIKSKWLCSRFDGLRGAAQPVIPFQAGRSASKTAGDLDLAGLLTVLERSNSQITASMQEMMKQSMEQVGQLVKVSELGLVGVQEVARDSVERMGVLIAAQSNASVEVNRLQGIVERQSKQIEMLTSKTEALLSMLE